MLEKHGGESERVEKHSSPREKLGPRCSFGLPF